MTKKQKKMLFRILLGAALTLTIHLLPVTGLWRFALFLIPYLIVGYDILRKAAQGILHRQLFDESFLMAVATLGALGIGLARTGDYTEAVAVMLFYQIGELFQGIAIGKSRRSIAALMDIRPDVARIKENGDWCEVDPEEVPAGALLLVRPGERIPLDGVVVDGRSLLDTAALTGEGLPREVAPGDAVISGCINQSGVLQIQTTKVFGESTVSRILELVENATSRKSRSERFISKFSKYYTPLVCLGALLLGLVPPLVLLATKSAPLWSEWIYRALSFLVISCPCALVISIPLTFFAGIGGASRVGILIKGSNHLESLAAADTVVFDKTGTLTTGCFAVTEIHAVKGTPQELLSIAAHAECDSTHPIARSICTAFGRQPDRSHVGEIRELRGGGISATVDGRQVLLGNEALLREHGISVPATEALGTMVHLAVDTKYTGYLVASDQPKSSAKEAIRALRRAGIRRSVLLSGDRRTVAVAVADALELDEVAAELLPEDKVTHVERLLTQTPPRGKLVFVGDGINDAPVLARADVGIAMGALGSDAAIEAADIVLMDDDPKQISTAIRIARKCMGIVYQNIALALGIKALCLVLGALGIANLWLAIFADVGVMVLAVLNAIRALFVPTDTADTARERRIQ